MKLEQIIRNRKGSAGSGGAWRVETIGDRSVLLHYSTVMLRWRETPKGVEILDYSTGHGSKSDQGGMNIAFSVLGTPYYFSRKGGAEIIESAKVAA